MLQRKRGSQINRLIKTCSACGCDLIVGENITQYGIDHRKYMCNVCKAFQQLAREYRSGKHKPMSENRECALYLGVHIAERVLSHVFDDVRVMPHGNKGYDFVCNKGRKIDIKSTCVNYSEGVTGRIVFNIKKNVIADYFLCLVFDDRSSLIPLYIWIFPSSSVSHLHKLSASISTLGKWDEYKIDKVDDIITCCNILRKV